MYRNDKSHITVNKLFFTISVNSLWLPFQLNLYFPTRPQLHRGSAPSEKRKEKKGREKGGKSKENK